jgi:hypothetical protein
MRVHISHASMVLYAKTCYSAIESIRVHSLRAQNVSLELHGIRDLRENIAR